MHAKTDQYPIFEKGSQSALYRQITIFCINHLVEVVAGIIHMEIPDTLEQPSQSYKPIQESMLKRERTVRHAYEFQVEKLFFDFKTMRRSRMDARRTSEWLSLGLGGQNSAQLQNSIGAIGDKYQKEFSQSLKTFIRRIKKLINRSNESNDDNPLSPSSLCNAFLASVEALHLSNQKTCQLLELYDQVLARHLSELFRQIDLGFYYLGILPELTDPKLLSPPVEGENPPGPEFKPEEKIDTEHLGKKTDNPTSKQAKKQKKLRTKKNKARIKAKKTDGILRKFKANTTSGSFDYTLLFQSLDKKLGKLLKSRQIKEIRQFTLYFSSLLKNSRLSPSLRKQLSRLSYPLIELVLVDPFFFRSSSHPVNDFIQSIIDFEIRHTHQDKDLAILTRLIDQLMVFDKPLLSDFKPIINDYEEFKQAEHKRLALVAKEKKLSNQKLSRSILNIINEITERLYVDKETLEFFYDDWQLLILQLARKSGQDSEEYKQSIEIARILAWSLAINKERDHAEFGQYSFTSILKVIERGLLSLNYSTARRIQTRKQLIKEFRQVNKDTGISIVSDTLSNPPGEMTDYTSRIGYNSPKNDDNSSSDSMSTKTEHAIMISEITIGSWVEIRNDDGISYRPAKLKWKSSNNDRYVFIDQRGHKIMETDLEKLDDNLTNGIVRVINKASTAGKSKVTIGSGFHHNDN